ncbi:Cilia and flagella-associated protein 47 [Taenia solium]|eukprot:TsM_000939400 transcript=TsM_000939400 gene=TsM_000939400
MLPLIVNGKRVETDTCRITATSVRALVNVSPRVISVKFSPAITKSTEIILKKFRMESCTNQVIKWRIDKRNLPPKISIKRDGCDNDDLCGTLRDANSPLNFLITLTPDHLNFHTLEIPIIVEDETDGSQISILTIHVEKVEVKLTCHPSHVILPPIPLCTRVEIDLHLRTNFVEHGFQMKHIGFVTWDGNCLKKCPFSLDSGSQELVVQLQIESSRIFAISNRPQPPCLLFIAESLGDGVKLILHACVPFVSGERLVEYQRELDSRTSRVIERWLRHYGFPGGIRGVNFPIDFQRCLSLHHIRLQEQHQKNDQVVHSLDVLVECLAHMAGFWSLHGVPRSLTLPIGDTATCIGALYNHHAALVCFVESQGGCVGHIAPEHLMTYTDCLDWICNGRPCGCEDSFNVDIPNMATLDGVSITPTLILSNPDGKVCLRYPMTPILEKGAFERTSRIAWTDLFLQLLRTLEIGEGAEAKLLQWINGSMAHGWAKLREANTQPNVSTWTHLSCPKVKNFHEDLASGLALAAVIASQAPFMIAEVLSEINLDPKSPQLLFHNAVQVVKALELMQLDVDLTPGDIFHPNALHMTLALSRLYRLLPEYKVQSTISFKEFLLSTSPKRIFFWYLGKVIFHEDQQWYFDSLVRPLG